MQGNSTRRNFLHKTMLASVGLALFSVSAFSENSKNGNKIFSIGPDGKYPDLRASIFSGKQLTVEGVVYNKYGSVPRNDVTIEVWQIAAGEQKKISNGMLRVNEQGEFAFKADFPKKEKGKNGRIFFNVSSNENAYTTELIVNDFGAFVNGKHWELNNQLGDKLFPQKQSFANHAVVSFNLSI